MKPATKTSEIEDVRGMAQFYIFIVFFHKSNTWTLAGSKSQLNPGTSQKSFLWICSILIRNTAGGRQVSVGELAISLLLHYPYREVLDWLFFFSKNDHFFF